MRPPPATSASHRMTHLSRQPVLREDQLPVRPMVVKRAHLHHSADHVQSEDEEGAGEESDEETGRRYKVWPMRTTQSQSISSSPSSSSFASMRGHQDFVLDLEEIRQKMMLEDTTQRRQFGIPAPNVAATVANNSSGSTGTSRRSRFRIRSPTRWRKLDSTRIATETRSSQLGRRCRGSCSCIVLRNDLYRDSTPPLPVLGSPTRFLYPRAGHQADAGCGEGENQARKGSRGEGEEKSDGGEASSEPGSAERRLDDGVIITERKNEDESTHGDWPW